MARKRTGKKKAPAKRTTTKHPTTPPKRSGRSSALLDTRIVYCGDCTKGFFVAPGYTRNALREIDGFFRESGKAIIAVTVHEILDEQIARKLV